MFQKGEWGYSRNGVQCRPLSNHHIVHFSKDLRSLSSVPQSWGETDKSYQIEVVLKQMAKHLGTNWIPTSPPTQRNFMWINHV